MNWTVSYLPEAKEELKSLDGSIKGQVIKGIRKVAQNPLPKNENGYGTPLGNKNGIDLSGLLKIKFLNIGIRVVYKLVKQDNDMKIIIISARSDNAVYKDAANRRKKNNI